MWLCKPRGIQQIAGIVLAVPLVLSVNGCTVEPLNSSQPDSKLATNAVSGSTSSILASTAVQPVHTRIAQQVRNNLLFAMNGGKLQPGGQYEIRLKITSKTSNLSIENSSLAPTSAKVVIICAYDLIEIGSGKSVAKGKQSTFAGFDRTPQSFANERAERDAQNRAAKQVAGQVRIALAQHIADL